MAEILVTASFSHVGHLEGVPRSYPQGGGSVGGEIRPVCDTCDWKGPRYGPGDEAVALIGLEAHIQTVGSSKDGTAATIYGMTYQTIGWIARWEWDWYTLDWSSSITGIQANA